VVRAAAVALLVLGAVVLLASMVPGTPVLVPVFGVAVISFAGVIARIE
jgi:hypothetical protein